jgi:hypothetical protein
VYELIKSNQIDASKQETAALKAAVDTLSRKIDEQIAIPARPSPDLSTSPTTMEEMMMQTTPTKRRLATQRPRHASPEHSLMYSHTTQQQRSPPLLFQQPPGNRQIFERILVQQPPFTIAQYFQTRSTLFCRVTR